MKIRIAQLFGVSVDYLVGATRERKRYDDKHIENIIILPDLLTPDEKHMAHRFVEFLKTGHVKYRK